ncbi:MAG: hypothetical protein LBU65_00265 [Planctomycetaceae bacterium]|jgi:hypothetical protein|nr:hypothetical protein [Planctomycetaceae bacterium]
MSDINVDEFVERASVPGIIFRKLRSLERLLRFYVTVDGLATGLVFVAVLFWIDIAADRFFQPAWGVRCFLLISMLAVVFLIFWRRLGQRVFARIRTDQLAMVLERQCPALNETLLTTVDFQLHDEQNSNANTADIDNDIHVEMLRITSLAASAVISGIRIGRMFRYGRLVVRVLAAFVMLGVIVGFCNLYANAASIWFSRCVLLSDAQWPRESRILIEGFDENGRVRIARGDSFTMIVRADTTMPLVPDTVFVRIGTKDAGFRGVLIDEFRLEDRDDGISYRTFTQTFQELLESVELTVQSGDVWRSGLQIEVVPPPVLTDLRLMPRYPDYMPPTTVQSIRPTARTVLPPGCDVTLDAAASKRLRQATLIYSKRENDKVENVENVLTLNETGEQFTASLTDLREDTAIELVLEDFDGLKNRQPIRFEIAMQPDIPPAISTRLRGIGAAITPQATLPVEGQVTDDYGVGALRFVYTVDRLTQAKTDANKDKGDDVAKDDTAENKETGDAADSGEVVILRDVNVSQYQVGTRFAAADLKLNAGDRLTVTLEARDNFFLPGMSERGQVGTGEKWTLDVVTPEQLKTMLDVREITLRQRFEVVIEEVRRTKAMIEELVFEPENLTNEQTGDATDDTAEGGANVSEIERQRREQERAAKLWAESASAEQVAAGQYNVTRSLRDIQKEVYDCNAIRSSLEDVRLEMVNNAIFTPETQQRVDESVLAPLRLLVETDFVSLEEQTNAMNSLLERKQPQPSSRREATDMREAVETEYDKVLARMTAIRDGMLSMETYAEAIELLRNILRRQEELRNETQEKKKSELRSLIE